VAPPEQLKLVPARMDPAATIVPDRSNSIDAAPPSPSVTSEFET
jgi:hypothetical protein